MSSRPDQLARIKDCKKYSGVLRDDKDFLIFEIEKRNRVIKILGDAIKAKLEFSGLDHELNRAKAEFEKVFDENT
jgi:hypothetical protein